MARARMQLTVLSLVGLLATSAPTWAASATRTSSFAYDPGSGLLIKEIIEPDQPQDRLETAYTLDAFGNREHVTVSSPATGQAAIAPRTVSSGYDEQGRFATSATNALGHVETRAYDVRFGAPISVTDPNGLATTFEYDAFGRKTLETRPDGTRTTFEYEFCAGVHSGTTTCPAHAIYRVKATPFKADGTTQNGSPTKTYFDALNREVQTKIEGFDGREILVATEYDGQGRVARKSRPYFANDPTVYWTTFAYDAIGRVTTETAPDNSTTTISYAGLTTTTTNALGQIKTTVRNSQRAIVSVTAGKADELTVTTSYAYDPFGNVVRTTDPAGNVITIEYDIRGRKVAVNDPSMGRWTYAHDALGQIVQQTDAKGQVTTMAYDTLGRQVSRTGVDLVSTWVFDTAVNGIGKLAQARATDAANAPVHQRDHSYDGLGRPAGVAIAIAGTAPYAFASTYGTDGRLETVTYPSGLVVRYAYNTRGYLTHVRNHATGAAYSTIEATTADGQLKQSLAGNGRRSWRNHDPATGRLIKIETWSGVQGLSYVWDPVGNLVSRTDHIYGYTESFTYDALNRVTSTSIPGRPTRTFQYDAIGNITFKSDTGTYTYPAPGAAQPYAVQSVAGALTATYTYDANGNMLAGAGRTITWTGFNMPAAIGQGASTLTFAYDAEYNRARQIAPDGTTLYLHDPASGVKVEKFIGASGVVQWNDYIWAGADMVAVVYQRSTGETLTRYFHKDHLGSIQVITDEAAAKVEHLSYDVWGKRRQYNGWDDPSGSVTSLTDKGFTGHEHLEEVGLIHMNGRVYDPRLGRFTAADPILPSVRLALRVNRYAYGLNNPLAYTDPSGFLESGGYYVDVGQYHYDFYYDYVYMTTDPTAVLSLGSSLGAMPALNGGYDFGALDGLYGGDFIGVTTGGILGSTTSPVLGTGTETGFGGGLLGEPVGARSNALSPGAQADGTVRIVVGASAGDVGGGKFENGATTESFDYLYNGDPSEYSRNKPGWHGYIAGPHMVCTGQQACTAQEIGYFLPRNSLPGHDPSVPVVTNGIYPIYDPWIGKYIGDVRTDISDDGLTVVNTTLPGHWLYKGEIARLATRDLEGAWYVTTYGYGNNIYPGVNWLNDVVGKWVFNFMDWQMKMQIENHRSGY